MTRSYGIIHVDKRRNWPLGFIKRQISSVFSSSQFPKRFKRNSENMATAKSILVFESACFSWKMESRRLAILCSHIRPSSGPAPTRQFSVSRSNCDAGGLDTNEQPSEGSHRNDCVFCKIITGESPAFKVETKFPFLNLYYFLGIMLCLWLPANLNYNHVKCIIPLPF